ncbi:MAG TPA: PEGA domain-containing protein [Polyangia bacterium]|nr:PEGA domain-containing protein [Polyangia bacterium]
MIGSNLGTWIVRLATVGAMALTAQPALADQADDLIHSGLELRRQGRDQEALQIFRKAQALSPTPRAQAQIGLAEQAVGQWVDAFDDLGAALRVKSDPWITKNRAVLESAVVSIETHVGELEILGGPSGAEVTVEGKPQGTLPLPSRLHAVAGTASVEVRASGFLPATRTVVIVPGQLTRETINLRPVSALPLPSGGGSFESAQESAPSTGNGEVGRSAETETSPWPRRAAWIGVAGAGAFAIGGTAALLVRQSKAHWFEDKAHACDENAPNKGGAGCQSDYDDGQTATKMAVIGYVAAGAFAAGAAVLFLTAHSAADAPKSTAVGLACLPSVGGLGVACAAWF